MELVEGETLADRLRRGALPSKEAMAVARDIAVALEAAHERGVLLQVSSGGGFHPVWARSGKELFYRVDLEGDRRRMMLVEVHAGATTRISRARALFEDSYDGSDDTSFDVLPDGQHFVMIEVKRDPKRISHFDVVLNWFEELKRLVPSR
jgi:hypothetical protein